MKAIRRILIAVLVLAVVLAGAEFGVRALVQSQAQQALTGSDLDLEQTVEAVLEGVARVAGRTA